jgi:molecular chaperone GrpE (heat shock protein)
MMRLVEQLRAGPNSGDPLFEKAADEIERLEAKASQLASTLATRMLDKSKDKEIERLLRLCQDMANVQQQNEQTYGKAADDIDRLREFNTKLCVEIERLTAALEIIAGRRQCLDNLMGNMDVACAALDEKP